MQFKKQDISVFVILILNILFYWFLIKPAANFGPDEKYQYAQALFSDYASWFPPLLSFLTQIALKIGLNFSGITFIQCSLSFIGLLILIKKLNQSLNLNVVISSKVSLIVFLILTSPFSPFPYKTMYYGNDIWFIIFFIFFIILLFIANQNFKNSSKLGRYFMILLLGIFSALICSVRNNSILLLPFTILNLYPYLKFFKRNIFFRLVILIFPIIATLSLKISFDYFLEVKKIHTKNVVMIADNISLIYKYPILKDKLPYTSSILRSNFKEKFDINSYGWNILTYQRPLIITEDSIWSRSNKILEKEYFKIVFSHPFKLFYIKFNRWLSNFSLTNKYSVNIIEPSYEFLYKGENILSNESQIGTLNKLRIIISKLNKYIIDKSMIIRLLFRSNILWFIINILLIIYFINSKNNIQLNMSHTFILLLPLCYYFSYLIATPAVRFRYMYPSNLIVQVYFFSTLFNSVLNSIIMKSKALNDNNI